MVRKALKWGAVALFIVMLFPQAVEAAAGAFTSGSNATPAVAGTNSSAAAGAKGVQGYANAVTTQPNMGVYGVTKSPNGIGVFGENVSGSGFAWGIQGRTASATGRGVEGYASSSSGLDHQGLVGSVKGGGALASSNISGVWGQALGTGWANGVFGVANASNTQGVGVRGLAEGGFGAVLEGSLGSLSFGTGVGAVGFGENGSFSGLEGVNCSLGTDQQTGNCITGAGVYGVVSDDDLGVSGHLLGSGTNVAGTCVVPNGAAVSAATCTFQDPWPMSGSRPLITATAEGNPGSYYWVELINDGTNYTGIKVHTGSAVGQDTTFDYHVIGVDSSISPAARQKAAAERRFARYGG